MSGLKTGDVGLKHPFEIGGSSPAIPPLTLSGSCKRPLTKSDSNAILALGNQTISRASERRDDMGLYRRGPTWWMSFTYKGRRMRQSTETGDRKTAEKIFHKVMTQVAEGKWFEATADEQEEATFQDLANVLFDDYRVNLRKSLWRVEISVQHLEGHFKCYTANAIGTQDVRRYISARLEQKASNGTINRELSALKRMFPSQQSRHRRKR